MLSIKRAGIAVALGSAFAILPISGAGAAPDPADAGAAAAPCGQSTKVKRGPTGEVTETDYYWRNCSKTGDNVGADLQFSPDKYKCVPAGTTRFVIANAPGSVVGKVRGLYKDSNC